MATHQTAHAVDVAALFAEHGPYLVRLAWSLTGDEQAAADIVQTAFSDALHRPDTLQSASRPDLVLRRMVINRCSNERRDRFRRQIRDRRITPPGESADDYSIAESTRRFFEMVRDLPTRQQHVVVLRYLDDMAVADIADLLNISVGTVKTSLHRARHTLAINLENHEVISSHTPSAEAPHKGTTR